MTEREYKYAKIVQAKNCLLMVLAVALTGWLFWVSHDWRSLLALSMLFFMSVVWSDDDNNEGD